MTDFLKGLGHGFASLVGLGDLYDPMGDLRSQLSKAASDQTAMMTSQSLSAALEQAKVNQVIIQASQAASAQLQSSQDLSNELIWDSMSEQNIFIGTVIATVIIIVFFMIIQKKCC